MVANAAALAGAKNLPAIISSSLLVARISSATAR
jgi:hypothetical protein